MSVQQVRVRIAPSPTGDPHVGTAYIALFNRIYAKKMDGKFILRIEDTDQSRSRSSSEAMIFSMLRWLGLDWDEGPDVGGDFGPYRQSERIGIYKEHAEQLINKGHAYRCFCTAERLAELRISRREQGLNTGYDGHCRELPAPELERQLAEGTPYVVRMAVPKGTSTTFRDHLRGDIEINHDQIDDQVILKSDGFPTYHLANVVDDHLMKISHVIRAEEWISSTPKHKLLYEFFGWDEPQWIHMPLLRNQDQSKISKRKNPVSLAFYKRAGILPEAMVNFLALMGWSYESDQEIFSLGQMQQAFDFKDVSLGGPVFDQTKLNWVNQQYLSKLPDEAFCSHLRQGLFGEEYLMQVKPLLVDRIHRFDEFIDKGSFFFNGALSYDGVDLVPKGKSGSEVRKMLKGLVEKMDECYQWDHEILYGLMAEHKDELQWKPKDYFMTVRLVTTGRKDSPPLAETLEVLGREIVRFRLRDAMEVLKG